MLKTIKNILKFFLLTCTLFFMVFIVLMSIGKLVFHETAPRVFGISTFVISTGSMRGDVDSWSSNYTDHINPGDIAIVLKSNNFKVGDVVTFFASKNEIITHRIFGIDAEGNYITRGDANNIVDDKSLNSTNIIGKVQFVIPKLGYVSAYIKGFAYMVKGNPLFFIGLILIFSSFFFLVLYGIKFEDGKFLKSFKSYFSFLKPKKNLTNEPGGETIIKTQ